MSLPESIFTGQLMEHNPSVAQVSSPEYENDFTSDAAICGSFPLFVRDTISLWITIRCLGVSVRPEETHEGSQNPHSVHLSMTSPAAGSGFRFFK